MLVEDFLQPLQPVGLHGNARKPAERIEIYQRIQAGVLNADGAEPLAESGIHLVNLLQELTQVF